jgi:hypothetical protein
MSDDLAEVARVLGELVNADEDIIAIQNEQLDRVAALHQRDEDDDHACRCGLTWPCATARALGAT